MRGMSSANGKPLSGTEHLRQSIRDILITPIGSRVMRRDYGSQLFQLIDKPLNESTLVDIYSAVSEALAKWEPRIKLTRVKAEQVSSGGWVRLYLEGYELINGKKMAMDGLII